ncbi:hypothetical protein [Asticcacaulis sp. 201]|uniref:hypothetical protein n=1 Tax=Asticcacaulis sp. 201 TaxID=3028787 RepID=UPI002915F55D|nr:hypothetical protein [Asticcacaulis sp. 201]MDV6333264.1 hypothetical protein [Asticcacaulis sp. 201]
MRLRLKTGCGVPRQRTAFQLQASKLRSRKRTFADIFLIGGAIFFLVPAGNACAQSAYITPEVMSLDVNGVDLGSGIPFKEFTYLSIGSPRVGGLQWSFFGEQTAYSAPDVDSNIGKVIAEEIYVDRLNQASAKIRKYTVSIGSFTDIFYKDCTNYTCSATNQGPIETETLQSGLKTHATLSTSPSTYTYTSREGVEYTFDIGDWYTNGRLRTIKWPNGIMSSFFYDFLKPVSGTYYPCTPGNGCSYRLRAVSTNTGYELKYEYDSDPTIFNKLIKVYAANTLSNSCNPTTFDCSSYDNYISASNFSLTAINGVAYSGTKITDSLGNYSLFGSGDVSLSFDEHYIYGLKFYQNQTGAQFAAVYSGSEKFGTRKTVVTTQLGTWTYNLAKPNSAGTRTSTATSPDNVVYLSSEILQSGEARTAVDALSRSTLYGWGASSKPGTEFLPGASKIYERVITGRTLPEGNMVQYWYDSRGNIIRADYTPKSGSGLATTSIYASFDTNCVNVKICNKPIWTKDANGNQTDYTYDSAHGGILTITLPTDQNGLRKRTYNTYTSFDTGNGIVYRLIRSETCGLSAGQLTYTACPATTTTLVTTTDYGSSTTAPYTYKSFLPYQVTQTDGAGSLTATTTYGYDAIGNVTSIDGPLAGSDDKVFKTYDANRRVICEIGADPDGSGPLIREMVRHTYDGAGQEIKTEQGSGTSTTNCLSTNMAVSSFTRMTYDAAGRLAKTEVVQP